VTHESAAWFFGQIAAIVLAAWVGWRVTCRAPRAWKAAATLATLLMLLWPLMRVVPAHVMRLVGASCVSFTEITGIVIPATVVFTIAARKATHARERRVLVLLLPVCLLYFGRHGGWMLGSPVPDLGHMRRQGDICIQTTGYTCVAASMVTTLRAYGIEITETEAARLCHTEVQGGTTDSRAVAGLQRRLAELPIEVRYEHMDYNRLRVVPKPCMVSMKWGYFISHMVPVLDVTDDGVKVGDPLNGLNVMPKDQFLDKWHKNGIFLVDHRAVASAPG
jgi:predicted double-glycine peptidase